MERGQHGSSQPFPGVSPGKDRDREPEEGEHTNTGSGTLGRGRLPGALRGARRARVTSARPGRGRWTLPPPARPPPVAAQGPAQAGLRLTFPSL